MLILEIIQLPNFSSFNFRKSDTPICVSIFIRPIRKLYKRWMGLFLVIIFQCKSRTYKFTLFFTQILLPFCLFGYSVFWGMLYLVVINWWMWSKFLWVLFLLLVRVYVFWDVLLLGLFQYLFWWIVLKHLLYVLLVL